MGKVVLHMDKGKKGSSGGLTSHIDRSQKELPNNIDRERSHLNFSIIEKKGTIDEMINERITQGYKMDKTIRKDAVTSCRFVLSGSHEEMKSLSPAQIENWAYDNYRFFADRHGEDNIVRAEVHLDEKTPHMHLIVVPLTEEGKLSADHFFGTKQKLRDLQTDYANEVGKKYGLERGQELLKTGQKNVVHTSTADFYKFVAENELNAEKILNHKHSKEIIANLLNTNYTKKEIEKFKSKPNITQERNGTIRGIQEENRPENTGRGGEQQEIKSNIRRTNEDKGRDDGFSR